MLFLVFVNVACAVVQDLELVHKLAMDGNLTRFVHIKLAQGVQQEVALNGVMRKLAGDDAVDVRVAQRRRLTGIGEPQRIFRPAGKHEEKHSSYGLDRWFKIAVAAVDDDVVQAGLAVEEALLRITKHEMTESSIEYAEASCTSKLLHRPNDFYRNLQDHYDSINLDAAHDITAGSSDVVVAVIDTGLQLSHPDFQKNVWTNKDEICGNGIDDDDNGYTDDCYGYNFADNLGGDALLGDGSHGTHCSGTIAADTDNSIGVAGVAGGKNGAEGVKIMTATVFGKDDTRGFAESIVYAADMDARISSNSWGYTSFGAYSQSVLDAIDYATDAGCIVVFAAGNDDSEHPSYPGHYHKTVNVAALNDDGTRATFSNYGFSIDISAPGVSVLSTVIDDYAYYSGTSMACPHVSGLLALGFSVNPALSNDAALKCLYSTATSVENVNSGFENYLGAGMIDAYAFLQCAAVATLPPTSMALDSETLSCDFEDAYLCGWTTGNTAGKAWARRAGGTPSVGTGPDDSDGFYVFVEASYEFNAGPYEMTSAPFSSGGADSEISFDYHMSGSFMGSLSIHYYDGSSWVQLWSVSGDQGSQWLSMSGVNIPASAIRLKFEAYTGSSYTSDICIDNVVVSSIAPTAKPVPAPTTHPSPAPSLKNQVPAPTVSVSDSACAVIVDGNPSDDSSTACVGSPDLGQPDSMTVHRTSRVAGTFCCGGDAAFCDFDCEVVDFATAQAECSLKGLRLCTESELLAGAATGKGCSLDHMHVWSSTTADCPSTTSDVVADYLAECVAEIVTDVTCESKKLCAGIADGNPNIDSSSKCRLAPDKGLDDYLVVKADSAAGVRCCSDDGRKSISVCSSACELVDYDEAERRCEENGMRLCTAAEVLNGKTKGTGCGYDKTHVWVGDRFECDQCAAIVDGRWNSDSSSSCPLSPDRGLANSLTARMDTMAAGVRCCPNSEESDAKSLCEYRCERVDFETAKARCEEEGMRLCTGEEILGGLTAGSGCGYDRMHVWAADTMDCSYSFVTGTTPVCVVDGDPTNDSSTDCGGVDSESDDAKLADPEYEIAGIRCCGKKDAASFCPSGDCQLVTYETAKRRCAEEGMRLCSVEELLAGETAGTGCGYDNAYVWSSNEGSCETSLPTSPSSYDLATKLEACIKSAQTAVECKAIGD